MSGLVTYERDGEISRITFGDGKVNIMSVAMLTALHDAFDRAERDKTIVILSSTGKHFSAGFDTKIIATGKPEDHYTMVRAGAELALRILSFPMPVITACHGNAFPMGAFLILASDYRIAADGNYKIGLNEVAIGITPPRFAVELARQRLTPAYLSRTAVLGEMFEPEEACAAGFFDHVVPADELQRTAADTAEAIGKINFACHALAKSRTRGAAIKLIRTVIDEDITLSNSNARTPNHEPA